MPRPDTKTALCTFPDPRICADSGVCVMYILRWCCRYLHGVRVLCWRTANYFWVMMLPPARYPKRHAGGVSSGLWVSFKRLVAVSIGTRCHK